MTFNIFNKNTWSQEEKCKCNLRLEGKAIGAIGNIIPKIRDLKKVIYQGTRCDTNLEYQIAQHLKNDDPSAHHLMGITYTYPNDDVKFVINNIDELLTLWATHDKSSVWRRSADLLLKLEPYLSETQAKDNVFDLTQIKVQGNAAWYVYLKSQLALLEAQGDITAKRRKIRELELEEERD